MGRVMSCTKYISLRWNNEFSAVFKISLFHNISQKWKMLVLMGEKLIRRVNIAVYSFDNQGKSILSGGCG